MRRKPIMMLLVGYGLLVLLAGLFGTLTSPSVAYADGGGNGHVPPAEEPADSTGGTTSSTEDPEGTSSEDSSSLSLTLAALDILLI